MTTTRLQRNQRWRMQAPGTRSASTFHMLRTLRCSVMLRHILTGKAGTKKQKQWHLGLPAVERYEVAYVHILFALLNGERHAHHVAKISPRPGCGNANHGWRLAIPLFVVQIKC